jgi:hypothetical protein
MIISPIIKVEINFIDMFFSMKKGTNISAVNGSNREIKFFITILTSLWFFENLPLVSLQHKVD